ncbi:MAG: hypothetical protein VX884_03280 [Pseudomonadota bacterium]|nr:hypothetical protein [Pseudomonadota bacterium]
MRKTFSLPALLVALTGGAILLFSPQGKTEQAKLPYDYWQTTYGVDLVRTLAVRNKMAERDYTAEFIVYDTGHKKTYTATIEVETDDFPKVLFPYDFRQTDGSGVWGLKDVDDDPDRKEGNYIWNCIVEGEVVLSGPFSYSDTVTRDHHGDLRERKIAQ